MVEVGYQGGEVLLFERAQNNAFGLKQGWYAHVGDDSFHDQNLTTLSYKRFTFNLTFTLY